MQVKVTFTEPVLGMSPANTELYSEFIAAKAPDAKKREEEIEALGASDFVEKSMTIFPKENGVPYAWDYQWRGFFKDSLRALLEMGAIDLPAKPKISIWTRKRIVDGGIFVNPRKIMFNLPEGATVTTLERPLRAETMRGERIALAISEKIDAGASMEFEIITLDKALDKVVEQCLDFGKLRGFGQWRNSGMGRFDWEMSG